MHRKKRYQLTETTQSCYLCTLASIKGTIKHTLNIITQANALTPLRQPCLLVLFKNIFKRFVWRKQSKQQDQSSNTKHPQDQPLQAFSATKRKFRFQCLVLKHKEIASYHNTLPLLCFPTSSSYSYLKTECIPSSFLPSLTQKREEPSSSASQPLQSGPNEGTCAAAGCSPTCASPHLGQETSAMLS